MVKDAFAQSYCRGSSVNSFVVRIIQYVKLCSLFCIAVAAMHGFLRYAASAASPQTAVLGSTPLDTCPVRAMNHITCPYHMSPDLVA